MKCKICNTRKPRRYCPGVSGDICAICCGEQREVTVACPLDCPFLREARMHEKPREMDQQEMPNKDIRVTEEFLRDHEPLLMFFGAHFLRAALSSAGAVDADVRQEIAEHLPQPGLVGPHQHRAVRAHRHRTPRLLGPQILRCRAGCITNRGLTT